LFRDPKTTSHAAAVVNLDGGLSVTLQEVVEGRPTRILFELDRPIDDTSNRLLAWQKNRIDRSSGPSQGTRVSVHPPIPQIVTPKKSL
jgi:hypothetical protein